jgi:hypothetical protein
MTLKLFNPPKSSFLNIYTGHKLQVLQFVEIRLYDAANLSVSTDKQ